MTTPPTLGQLDLFGSPQEHSLKAENAWLQERLARARTSYRQLRTERDNVAAACGELQAHIDVLDAQLRDWSDKYDQAQRDIRHWKNLCELERMVRTMGSPRTPTPALEPILKKLLTLSHPDKWSRGQPATELAHEMSIVLNDARRQVEGRP